LEKGRTARAVKGVYYCAIYEKGDKTGFQFERKHNMF
jgi:hypothetical protein